MLLYRHKYRLYGVKLLYFQMFFSIKDILADGCKYCLSIRLEICFGTVFTERIIE